MTAGACVPTVKSCFDGIAHMFAHQLIARGLLALGPLLAATAAQAGEPPTPQQHRFCGTQTQAMIPAELETVAGDLSLESIAAAPASMVVCGAGYFAVKCGDHLTANVIFDKCIAAGYTGAMIWKALLLEEGLGVEKDEAQATALMLKAAQSGHDGYATLGKLHYATALHQGKGVAKDEAAARRWFQAAADEGSQEAKDFLATGYHTGGRDRQGHGVGVLPPAWRDSPTVQRLVQELPADLPSALGSRWGLLGAALLLGLMATGVWRQACRRRLPHSINQPTTPNTPKDPAP